MPFLRRMGSALTVVPGTSFWLMKCDSVLLKRRFRSFDIWMPKRMEDLGESDREGPTRP